MSKSFAEACELCGCLPCACTMVPADEVEARIAQARREALEEAAKTVEREGVLAEQREEWFEAALVARRIRALARRPEGPKEGGE